MGGNIELRGTYLVTGPLITAANSVVHGAGTIKVSSSFAGTQVIIPADNTTYRDFTIDGSLYDRSAIAVNGIYSDRPRRHITIQNVTFQSWSLAQLWVFPQERVRF